MGTDGAGPGVPWKAYAPDLLCSCMSFLNSFWRQAPVRMELVKGEESLFLGLRKGSRDNRKKKGEWVTSPVPDHSLFPEWKFTQGSKWLYLGSQETEKLPHVKTRDLVLRARDVGGDWILNSIYLLGVFLGFYSSLSTLQGMAVWPFLLSWSGRIPPRLCTYYHPLKGARKALHFKIWFIRIHNLSVSRAICIITWHETFLPVLSKTQRETSRIMDSINCLKQGPICRLRGQLAAATALQASRVTYRDTSWEKPGSFPVCWFSVSIRIDLESPSSSF